MSVDVRVSVRVGVRVGVSVFREKNRCHQLMSYHRYHSCQPMIKIQINISRFLSHVTILGLAVAATAVTVTAATTIIIITTM